MPQLKLLELVVSCGELWWVVVSCGELWHARINGGHDAIASELAGVDRNAAICANLVRMMCLLVVVGWLGVVSPRIAT